MNKTNIEYFNDYLTLFIKSIIESFSEYKDVLEEYYSDLLESNINNDDKFVKRFMNKMKDTKTMISEKNDKLFKNDIYILKNVNFKIIWESGELSDNNKEKIWEYIQTLYILAETIINDTNTITNLIQSFKKLRETNENTDSKETPEIDNEMMKMLKNLSPENEKIDETFLNNGLIGKLASELTDELNIDDLNINMENSNNMDDIFSNLISGDNSLKFMNLIQTVGNKIQTKVQNGEFAQNDLFNEAKKIMSSMKGDNNIFSNMMNEGSAPINKTQERLRKKLEKNNKEKIPKKNE
mgnify:CR=1 FL=1